MGSRAALSRVGRVAVGFALALASLPGAIGTVDASGPSLITIGVDHADPANQDMKHFRVFEYTDFFARSVTVHKGEVIDFRTAPAAFHIVALAANEATARAAYPVGLLDKDDSNAPSRAPKIAFGPSNYPIVHGNTNGSLAGVDFTKPNGPPDCGVPYLHQAACTFSGGNDIEVAGPNLHNDAKGNPLPADWRIKINAAPGTYVYFCYIHPGMRGTLHVVAQSQAVTSQTKINALSAAQFAADRVEGLAAEKAANRVRFAGTTPGKRTYYFFVGVGTADNRVAIDEMFPNSATVRGGAPTIKRGDKVRFIWRDPHNVHTVYFPRSTKAPGPFGFDCDTGYVPAGNSPPCMETGDTGGPEVIGDPGNAAPGVVLIAGVPINAGIRVGTAYGLSPTSHNWWVTTNSTTAAKRYSFMCTVHDWMVGALNVHS